MKGILDKINNNRPLLYINVALFFFLLNGLAANLKIQADLSRDRVNSLSESTEKVLKKIDDRILIEAYISQDLPGQAIALLSPILSQLKEIERTGGSKIKYRLISPDTEAKRKEAEKRGIQGVRVSQQKIDESKVKLGYFGIYIQIGDKTTLISLLNRDPQKIIIDDFEYQFLRELKKLGKKRENVGAGFAQGPGLFVNRQPDQRSGFSKDSMFIYNYLLQQEGIRVESVPLSKRVPDKVQTLFVVGLPRLEAKEIYHLDQFLVRGGNIICMLKGFDFQLERRPNPRMRMRMPRQGMGSLASVSEKDLAQMNRWLGHYGVTVNGEILFEFTQYTPTFDFLSRYFEPFNNPVWGAYARESANLVSPHPALKDLKGVILPWFSGLDIKEAVQPHVAFATLLQSSPDAISKKSASFTVKNLHSLRPSPGDKRVPHPLPIAIMAQGQFLSAFTPENLPEGEEKERFRSGQESLGNLKGPIETLKKLVAGNKNPQVPESKEMGSLTVIGSPYLVSDIMLQNQFNADVFRLNQTFMTNLLEAVSGDTDLLAARSRVKTVDYIKNTQPWFESAFKYFHIFFIPLLLALYGTNRLVKRNQRLGLQGPVSDGSSNRNQGENPIANQDEEKNS